MARRSYPQAGQRPARRRSARCCSSKRRLLCARTHASGGMTSGRWYQRRRTCSVPSRNATSSESNTISTDAAATTPTLALSPAETAPSGNWAGGASSPGVAAGLDRGGLILPVTDDHAGVGRVRDGDEVVAAYRLNEHVRPLANLLPRLEDAGKNLKPGTHRRLLSCTRKRRRTGGILPLVSFRACADALPVAG